MRNSSFHILRVGLAITFLWIGVLIFKEPEAWGFYLQPWALKLLPLSLKEAMISTAILDIAIGVLLLIDIWTWFAAFLAAVHLIVVLTVSGIDSITVRDIGLLGGAVALLWSALPQKIKSRFTKK